MKENQLRKSWLLALLLLLGWSRLAQAQVTASPVFFTADQQVTLTFDASQGNMGLANLAANDSVFIYTGVITDQSTTSSDWKHVYNGSGFSKPTKFEKLTRSTTNRNLYTFTYTPRTFYGIGASEKVLKLAMVFRNKTGDLQGKGTGNTDLFVDVSQSTTTLQVALTSPSNAGAGFNVVTAGTSVAVAGTATVSATLTLTLNGTQVGQQTGTSYAGNVTISQPGINTLVLTATSGSSTATATVQLLVPPTPIVAELPAGTKPDGVTYLANGTSAIFTLTAPNKSYVYLLGDFNNWQPTTAGQLRQTSTVNSDAATGRWWVQVDGLVPGQEYAYQFLVDGNLRVADAYCDKILDPYNDKYISQATYPNLKAFPAVLTAAAGNVSVMQTGQTAYNWTTTNFVKPERTNLVVYELLMRDFTDAQNYKTATDTLKYLKRLGINAIELMPVNEFDGNDSWGYNPAFYFAPDKAYGTKDALKKFIDTCHANGIAVILDMVLNHSCGGSPLVQLYFNGAAGKPASNNPWYNVDAKHPFNVCYDFNHDSQYTRYFAKNVMKYWLQEYHVDGYRFDLSKGFTQKQTSDVGAWGAYDPDRVAIWTDYYNTIKATDATAYPILEHFADNSEDKALADLGMMPWGNMATSYQQATMGYPTNPSWDLTYGSYKDRGYAHPNLVTYMESHDEERTMYKNLTFGNSSGTYSTKDLPTALKREEMAAAVFFSQPGPRMIYEFEEVGFDKSIFSCSNGSIPLPYSQNDECKTSRKSPQWNYYQQANRRHLYDVYRAMIALKQQPAFAAPTNYAQFLYGTVKYIKVQGSDLTVVTYGNFDVVAQTTTVNFPTTGTWYNYLDGTTLNVTVADMPMTLQPGQYGVYTSRKIAAPAGTTLSTRAQDAAVLQLSAAPNPASGTTAVRYALPAAATASLSLQNVLGQTVRQLPAQRQTAGPQSQELSLQGLAPGLYLLKLQAGERTQTTRLQVN